jgi:hypothetical protein
MSIKPLAEVAPECFANFFLKLCRIGACLTIHTGQYVKHDLSSLFENLFPLFIAHKAPRDEIRPGNDLSGLLVNRHYNQHHTILGQVATIPNYYVFDIPDPFAVYKHPTDLNGLNLFRACGGHF